jgi:hypothetical protein
MTSKTELESVKSSDSKINRAVAKMREALYKLDQNIN